MKHCETCRCRERDQLCGDSTETKKAAGAPSGSTATSEQPTTPSTTARNAGMAALCEAAREYRLTGKVTPTPSVVTDVAETLGDTRVCPQCGVNVQDHALTTVDGVLLVHCPPYVHPMPTTPSSGVALPDPEILLSAAAEVLDNLEIDDEPEYMRVPQMQIERLRRALQVARR